MSAPVSSERVVSSDLLDMDYINGLGQLYVRYLGSKDWWWPLYDIDVQTGLHRIDVMGKLDCKHISDVAQFRDDNGKCYHPDDFYTDSESWIDRAPVSI
jgi:hypothetical protein